MRRTLALLTLALALAACSDDDGPRVADPAELVIQIVGGDGQTAPVRPAGGATTAALAPTAEIPEHILPEPLKARVVVTDPEPQAGLTGPSAVVLPSDLDVTFRVIQPADPFGRDCGASFLDGARPDDDGYVTTFWERGTLADVECRMEVRLVVDGLPRVDTVFVATFEPGPVDTLHLNGVPFEIEVGDTLDLRQTLDHGLDEHRNRVEASQLAAYPDSAVTWQWSDISQASAGPSGVGWTIVAPDPTVHGWWRRTSIGGARCWVLDAALTVWIEGAAGISAARFLPPEGVETPDEDPACGPTFH